MWFFHARSQCVNGLMAFVKVSISKSNASIPTNRCSVYSWASEVLGGGSTEFWNLTISCNILSKKGVTFLVLTGKNHHFWPLWKNLCGYIRKNPLMTPWKKSPSDANVHLKSRDVVLNVPLCESQRTRCGTTTLRLPNDLWRRAFPRTCVCRRFAELKSSWHAKYALFW